ncbi:MAG: binding 1 protein [Patescibacteria group bacterium]|jgi:methylated-DNA-protein-cysteine methyltransferase-like protein|nr:binding 1 protein [Patescibacteria group bacterium]
MKRKPPTGPTFSERVLKAALSVPAGRVTTYGRLARAAGGGGMAAQSITSILGKAYDEGATNIPFHRIVYADGHIWIDPKHRAERLARYKKEKIKIDVNDKVEGFRDVLFEFE